MEQNKTLSAQGAQQAAAMRQQQELTRQEEALAGEDDGYDGEDDMPQQNVAANVFDAFLGTLGSEMAKKQQEDAQRQRFLDNVRREAEAVDRQRQRDLERERLAQERTRLEQQAEQQRQQAIAQQQRQSAANAGNARAIVGTGGIGNSSAISGQQQTAKAREDTMRANVAAERKRLAEERERAAATERERVMRPFVEASSRQQVQTMSSAGRAAVSTTPKTSIAPPDYGPAKAWCQASNAGTFQCMGPLQNLLSWYPSLETALSQAGCPGGEGYNPTPGHGGSSFNCGRQLKPNDYRMPTYDPYRGGGKPVLV
ncbi:MAG: hypothetical protein DI584_11920, partial [Stenotrophomonas sp.]